MRTNKWHSVEGKVRSDDDGWKEIGIAADQEARWNYTYLTPRSARKLSALLLVAAKIVEKHNDK